MKFTANGHRNKYFIVNRGHTFLQVFWYSQMTEDVGVPKSSSWW